jgi:hypothetical protein
LVLALSQRSAHVFWVFAGLGCTIVVTYVVDGLLFRQRIDLS